MNDIVHLYYPLDTDALLIDAETARETAELHGGPKTQKTGKWLISYYENARTNKIMEDLNIKGKTRWYFIGNNFYVEPHVDTGTAKCAVCFVLSDNASPITIGDKDHHYTQALIDVQQEHSVKKSREERIILRFTIEDKNFETVAKEINYKHE